MTFEVDVEHWVRRKARDRLVQVHSDLNVRALDLLVSLTPVDTGRARASWRSKKGRIDKSVDTRPKRGGAEFPAAQIVGDAVLAGQFARARKAKPGGTVWHTNDLHYILPLEDGHSKKSRAMLRTTYGRLLAEFSSIVERSKFNRGPR